MDHPIYFCADAEDGRIPQRGGRWRNANITAHPSLTVAEAAYFAGGDNPDEWDLSEAELVPGDYGDCWIKLHAEPTPEQLNDFAPFTADQLRVERPGQHPGGYRWWVTPYPAVLTLVGVKPRGEG